MNGIFEWLVKLVFLALLAPFFICLLGQILFTAAAALLPWLIGLVMLMALGIGAGAGLVHRWRVPPGRHDRVPHGEIPRIRRPRGVRTER